MARYLAMWSKAPLVHCSSSGNTMSPVGKPASKQASQPASQKVHFCANSIMVAEARLLYFCL